MATISIKQPHKLALETCEAKTASVLQFSLLTKASGISINHKPECNSLVVLREELQLETLAKLRMIEQLLQ